VAHRNIGQRGFSAQPTASHSVPLVRQAENLDENRVVLYKRSKQLGAGYFIVEISSTKTHLNIAAYDVESPESLLIELPEKRAQDILREFQNDYERMACSLQVMNKRLVLLNPVRFLMVTQCRNLYNRKPKLRQKQQHRNRRPWRNRWRKLKTAKITSKRILNLVQINSSCSEESKVMRNLTLLKF
jgi:hypothetical protein